MKKNIQAFTLVELIVVITIIAILGTLGFVSFQGYLTQAKDSTRINDMVSIHKSLYIHKTEGNRLPEPDNSTDITYSGSVVWKQGLFGSGVIQELKKITQTITDPDFGVNYTYSVLGNNTEFQISGVLSTSHVAHNSVVGQTYAQSFKPFIRGNYNGIVTKTNGSTCYSLALPSLILDDTTQSELKNIGDDSLVINKLGNIPSSYSGLTNIPDVTFRNYSPSIQNTPIVYEGCSLSCDQSQLKEIANKLSLAYEGTGVAQGGKIKKELFDKDITARTNTIIDILNGLYETQCGHVEFNVSSLSPSGTVNIQAQTLQVVTNNDSICKYDTSDLDFASMAYTFDSLDNRNHTKLYNSNVGQNTVYVKCSDMLGSVFDENNVIDYQYSTGPVTINFTESSGGSFVCTSCN